jgi:hypothetical protein
MFCLVSKLIVKMRWIESIKMKLDGLHVRFPLELYIRLLVD